MKSTLLPATAGLLFCAHAAAVELDTIPSPQFVGVDAPVAAAVTTEEAAEENDKARLDLAQSADSAETEAVEPGPQSALDEAQTFGPIQPGESLSTVAMAISEDTGIHVAQVMWALYVTSPEAFKGSIGRLRVGATLTLPPVADITAVSIRQARINVRDAAAPKNNEPPKEDSAAAEGATDKTSAEAVAAPTTAKPVPTQPAAKAPELATTPAPTLTPTLVPTVAPTKAPTTAPLAPADKASNQNEQAPKEATILVPAVSPERASKDAASETETTDTSANAPALSGRQLVLPFMALAGFVVALLLGARRRRVEREEAEKAEQEAALRKRSDLVNLARGDYEDEPTQVIPTVPDTASTAGTDPVAENVTRTEGYAETTESPIEATQVMPVVKAEPATDDVDTTPDANLESFDDGINDGDDIDSALDLAQGYAGMGEIDRARSLLEMVASRGTPEQQAEARKALESLG